MKESLNVGITCYPTYGGSGVIATEIGISLARRGHKVHIISYDIPRRLTHSLHNVFYHEVDIVEYPLFNYPPYSLSLASKMVEVSTYEKLDILHAHYAVPHATSAYLAKQILKEKAPKVITTLHGTDITLVGSDPSYLPITRFSIMESDGVTAPSQYLKKATFKELQIETCIPIEVIPNFVDTTLYKPSKEVTNQALGKLLGKCTAKDKIITHVSNFRPVKRIRDVIYVFAKILKEVPAHLVLIGDGPERSGAEFLARELGIADNICFLGKQESFIEVLQRSDLFLLPSQTESFGLAALEAMACGVPVIAYNVGGLPEVVLHGQTGFLAPLGNTEEMAAMALKLLKDSALHQSFSHASHTRVLQEFSEEKMIGLYEEYYYKILKY